MSSHAAASDTGRLPDFVIIGAMKAGTTSLFEYVGLHPNAGLAERKELNFFIEHREWQRGLDWYRRQFARASAAASVGECSVDYTKRHHFAGVADRMAQVIPDAKLVYVVRDPIDRIVSQYVHQVAAGRERREFDLAVGLDDPESSTYILTSRYGWQLEPFRERFGEDQILVVSFEELVVEPARAVQQVYTFLELDPSFVDEGFGEIHNTSAAKKKPTALGTLLGRRGRGVAARLLPGLVWGPVQRPEVSDAIRDALRRELADDVAALRELSGQDFTEWAM